MALLMIVLLILFLVVVAWFVSVIINWIIAMIVTAPGAGPFWLDNRIFEMILERDYLSLGSYGAILRLIDWGGFLAWFFFIYVGVRDLLAKRNAVGK